MKIEKIDIRKPMVILFMTALLVFAFWKIRLGVHSDEVYLIALGDMIAKGDSFFKECWSSLQMSAVFTAPFIFVYEKITGGREGILLFFRGVAVCVQLGICIYFYRTFSEKYQKMYVLIASILLFTFIPDFQSFTYKQELLWFATLEIVYSYKYYLTYKRKYLVLLSIMIAGSVLAYPTAILQFPVYFCLIYWIHHIKQGRKNIYSHVYIMTITCLVCMTVFMGVVLSRISIFEFIAYFPKVFSDNNLEMSFLSKLLHPLLKFGIMGIVTIVSIAWCEKIKKIPIPIMTCLLCGALLGQMYIERSGVTWHCITYSYALTLFMMPLIYVLNEKNEKNRVLILLFEIPAVTVIFCIALASNQGNITSMYGTVFSAAGLLLMLSDNEKLKGGGIERSILLQQVCVPGL
jgi:hypothetical protein